MIRFSKPSYQHDMHRLARLRDERRKLSTRLSQLDKEIARLKPVKERKAPNGAEVNRWLDELSRGLDHLVALPADFSRADLYADHD
jgi:hypothetical protein